MNRDRVLIVAACALLVSAVCVDILSPCTSKWFDSHALTTDLISSGFLALVVSVVLDRVIRRREAAPWKIAAREAIQGSAYGGQRATETLRRLIDDRASEIAAKGDAADLPEKPGIFAGLATPRSLEITRALHTIIAVEPQWLDTVLAPNAARLADLASARVVAAGSVLNLADQAAALSWVSQDAETLRGIASAAEFMASLLAPPPFDPPSPLMKKLDEQMANLDLQAMDEGVAEIVRKGLVAKAQSEELDKEQDQERSEMLADSIEGIANMLATRETLLDALKRNFKL